MWKKANTKRSVRYDYIVDSDVCNFCRAEFKKEHHDLYRLYMSQRHPDGGMDEPEEEKYMEFLTSEWSETRFVEFRLDGQLAAVAVVDELDSVPDVDILDAGDKDVLGYNSADDQCQSRSKRLYIITCCITYSSFFFWPSFLYRYSFLSYLCFCPSEKKTNNCSSPRFCDWIWIYINNGLRLKDICG